MADYRIVCTEQQPVYQPTTHAHIVGVGTGSNPDKADTIGPSTKSLGRWIGGTDFIQLVQVLAKLRSWKNTRVKNAGEHSSAQHRMRSRIIISIHSGVVDSVASASDRFLTVILMRSCRAFSIVSQRIASATPLVVLCRSPR